MGSPAPPPLHSWAEKHANHLGHPQPDATYAFVAPWPLGRLCRHALECSAGSVLHVAGANVLRPRPPAPAAPALFGRRNARGETQRCRREHRASGAHAHVVSGRCQHQVADGDRQAERRSAAGQWCAHGNSCHAVSSNPRAGPVQARHGRRTSIRLGAYLWPRVSVLRDGAGLRGRGCIVRRRLFGCPAHAHGPRESCPHRRPPDEPPAPDSAASGPAHARTWHRHAAQPRIVRWRMRVRPGKNELPQKVPAPRRGQVPGSHTLVAMAAGAVVAEQTTAAAARKPRRCGKRTRMLRCGVCSWRVASVRAG